MPWSHCLSCPSPFLGHAASCVPSMHKLRAAILDGRRQSGVRLPPTRTFAARFGIARNAAVATYDLLLTEGYLIARAGNGTFVADVRPPDPGRIPL
jgi:DNA-binding GntR family transcriptional regulator